MAPARPHRDGRRDLRPSPPARRHGAGVRAPHPRVAGAGAPDQLRGVPGAHPPTHEVRDRREHVLELRPRRRALEERLRLPDRTRTRAGTRPGARRCARRWTGCATRSRRSTRAAREGLLPDPWAARDDYVRVMLDRSAEARQALPARARAGRPLRDRSGSRSGSCWSSSATPSSCTPAAAGSSTTSAASRRARSSSTRPASCQLARELFGAELEAGLREPPRKSRQQRAGSGRRRRIYEECRARRAVSLERVGATLRRLVAIHRVRRPDRIYCYRVDREDSRVLSSGRARLALGRVRVTSDDHRGVAARGLRGAPPGRPQHLRRRAARPRRRGFPEDPRGARRAVSPVGPAGNSAHGRPRLRLRRLHAAAGVPRRAPAHPGTHPPVGAARGPTTSIASCTRSTSR